MIFVMLLFSTSWFSWLCFPFSTSFCWLFSLFFVFFSSCQLFCCFSARAANFTWAICRLYNSHNSTVKFWQEAQTEIKGNMSDWLGHTALVSKGSEGVNADCHCLLCLSFCLMPTNSARIPEIHKPEFHRRAKQSHCKDSLLSIFARVLARQMLWFFFFFFGTSFHQRWFVSWAAASEKRTSAFDLVLGTFALVPAMILFSLLRLMLQWKRDSENTQWASQNTLGHQNTNGNVTCSIMFLRCIPDFSNPFLHFAGGEGHWQCAILKKGL